MDFNTHNFTPVKKQKNKSGKILLPVLAIVFAVLAIAAAVAVSFLITPPSAPVSVNPSDTTLDTQGSSDDTTGAPDTTKAPETTQIPIINPQTSAVSDTTTERRIPSPLAAEYTICVDPGHGYDDPGTSSDYLMGTNEKDVVLSIALYLREELQKYGYKVVMTHEDNINPPGTTGQYLFNPTKRIAYANSNFDFDYYISVHCDSFPTNESVYGTRIYYLNRTNQNNAEINKIASYLKNGIDSTLPASKACVLMPMDDANAYYVLKHAESFASILVETGFVSNPGDAAKMLDETWKQDMAKGIAAGINYYFSSLR